MSDETLPPRTTSTPPSATAYRIGTISVNKEGMFWVHWTGEHAGQGGLEFGAGNMGSTDLAFLLKSVGKNMLRCKEQYVKGIELIEAKRLNEAAKAAETTEEVTDAQG